MREKVRKSVYWIILAMLAVISIIFIVSASYAVYGADDFGDAHQLGNIKNLFGLLVSAVNVATSNWKSWQGTYFSIFVLSVFNPIAGAGYAQMRIVSVVNVIFLFGAIYVLLCMCCKILQIDRKMAGIFEAVVLFSILQGRYYNDIFYSYTCYMVYVSSFLMMIATVYIIFAECNIHNIGVLKYGRRDSKTKNAVTCIMICILCFCTGGSALCFAGAACWVILIAILAQLRYEHKLSRKLAGCFVVLLGFTLLNTIAPGNFARHNAVNSAGSFGSQMIISIYYAARACGIEIVYLMKDTVFPDVLLFLFIWGTISGQKVEKSISPIGICMLLLTPAVFVYPVGLGSGWEAGMPARVTFFVDLFLAVIMAVGIYWIGCMVRIHIGQQLHGYQLVMAALIMLMWLNVFSNGFSIRNNAVSTVARGLLNGETRQFYQQMNHVYDEIAASDSDVVKIYDYPDSLGYIINPFSVSDPNSWKNNEICTYYGKKQIIMVPREDKK